jgi:hypothetical protein
MAGSRYSQSELFKKALELTGGKGVAKRVAFKAPGKAKYDTDAGMIAAIMEEGLKGFLGGQADKLDKADRGAASRMRDDYLKPPPDWNVETDGTTPDALRAATMPGALTGNVGATYDPNVKPFPEEDFDDGTDTVRGMAAALGAPNAALGSPLDPGQPYAVGTDEEGDDANWMSAPEHAEFYKRAAAEAQAGFDVDNPTGMARVDQGDYGVAEPQSLLGQVFGGPAPVSKEQTNTLAMRDLLMGDTIAKRENKEAIARAIATRDEERTYQAGLEGKQFGREKELKQLEITAKGSKYGTPYVVQDPTSSTGRSRLQRNANGDIVNLGEVAASSPNYDPNEAFKKSSATYTMGQYKDATEGNKLASGSIALLDQMDVLVQGMPESGPGADTIAKMRGWGKTLGLPVDEGKLKTAEGMRSLTMQFVMKLVSQTKGAISNKEMDAFKAASVNIGNSQAGNRLILKMAKSTTERTIHANEAVRAAYGANPNIGVVEIDNVRRDAVKAFGPLWTPVRDVPKSAANSGYTQDAWDKLPVSIRYNYVMEESR